MSRKSPTALPMPCCCAVARSSRPGPSPMCSPRATCHGASAFRWKSSTARRAGPPGPPGNGPGGRPRIATALALSAARRYRGAYKLVRAEMTVMGTIIAIVLVVLIVGLALFTVIRAVQIVPQARAGIVERFGRYHRTLYAGLNLVMPFVDRLRPLIDLREQVVSFPPQPVITKDNLVVSIDTVIYFQVTDPKAATYEIANYVAAVEQLTITTLRNVVGGMDLDTTLTSRDKINSELRKELDDATGKWGLRVSRVELKAIEPPTSIQDSMEKQMRADRDKRAAILSAEGARQAVVLRARGEAEAAVVRADAEATAQATRARGEAQAIATVFQAIHE